MSEEKVLISKAKLRKILARIERIRKALRGEVDE